MKPALDVNFLPLDDLKVAANPHAASSATDNEDYVDQFVTLSPTKRTLTIQHPGIPLLGTTHTIPFHAIQLVKGAVDLELMPEEYAVWGPGPSWIWWAWDLRRSGLLKSTERERCFVARVDVGWVTFWVGFTVANAQQFRDKLVVCDLLTN
jgi:hypothetical protein